MKSLVLPAAMLAGLLGSPAFSVEATGGYVDLGYTGFVDTDQGAVFHIAGSGEMAFSRSFGLQLDVANYNFDLINEAGQNATLHANWHTGEALSLGGFVGSDWLSSSNRTFYGVEAGYEFSPRTQVEGYVSRYDGANGYATLVGARIEGSVANQISLNAVVDHVDAASNSGFTNVSIGADYDFGRGTKLYGKVGNTNAKAFGFSGDEAFVGIGLRFNIGASRGTTFGRRGLLDKITGF